MGPWIYLEAIELCRVSDVGDVVHVFEVPVVCLLRGQHGHPAKLVSHPLLQVWNHTGACYSDLRTLLYFHSKDLHL